MSEVRSAVLLVRVWLEDGDSFRARLTEVRGGGSDRPDEDRTIALAASPSDVLRSVGDWLDGFVDEARDGVDAPS